MAQTIRLLSNELDRAAQILRDGGRVAFPTETVYGLGADAFSDRAVAGIFAAKNRPSFNPLIVHVADMAAVHDLADVPPAAQLLAEAFWPGPLTLVLPAKGRVADLVSAGLDSVAIRIPGHPLARKLLQMVERPIAAPSANPSGRISPTTADHVLAGLDGVIEAVLDGGPCDVGLESTIVGFSDGPVLLRPGGLAIEQIERIVGPLGSAGDTVTAPGQLASHYAPAVPLRLNATAPDVGESYLGFGAGPAEDCLSATGDLIEAAANLFGALHRLEALGRPIAVAPIPMTGLGRAINDRLKRAAAPRP